LGYTALSYFKNAGFIQGQTRSFRLAGLPVKPVEPVQNGMLSVFTFKPANGPTGPTFIM
jgi:hypothetical protein